MSDDHAYEDNEGETNDIQPPKLPSAEMPTRSYVPEHSTVVLRPLGVTIVMVLCIIAGIGGLFFGCFSTAGMVFGQAITTMTGTDPDDPQMQLQAQLQETNHQMLIPNVTLTFVGAILSGCFLIGGFGLVKAKRWSLKLIRRTIFAAVFFECIRVALFIYMQLKNGPIMEDFYREMAKSTEGPDMSEMMVFFMWGGVAVWAVWAALKISVMIWSRVYLGGETAENYISQCNSQ